MRRLPAILVLVTAGCSTAPVADLLDLVAPGGPPRSVPSDGPPTPARRGRFEELPPPPGPSRDPGDPPPLPPVPNGYTPRS